MKIEVLFPEYCNLFAEDVYKRQQYGGNGFDRDPDGKENNRASSYQ